MRAVASIGAILALFPLGAVSMPAYRYVSPEVVGPPALQLGSCRAKMTIPGGTTAGAPIPIRGLDLGSPIERNATSFPTGGSGTANAALRARRMAAGLQYDPRTYDPAASARPSVFAVEPSQLAAPWVYQHLPVKTAGAAYGERGMIFAQATSRTSGRIASLRLILPAAPKSIPKVTIVGGRPTAKGCREDYPIDVYAPAMAAAQVQRLFGPSGCGWNNLAACAPREWPRGRVLFVQRQQGGSDYEYRWVDYDLLAAIDPRKARRS